MKRQFPGFTLIETLVVVSIFSILVVASVSLFTTALRGAGKAEVEVLVRQNGEYALSVISRGIRGATEIVTCTDNEIVYTDADRNTGSFECKYIAGNSDYFLASGSSEVRLTSDRVVVNPCTISCVLPGGSLPIREVNIDFTVNNTVVGSNPGDNAGARFKTKVVIRGN